MATNQALLSGGQLAVAALRAHGVDMAFSVAGESYLEVLDALFDAPKSALSPAGRKAVRPSWPRLTASSPANRECCS